MYPGPVQRSQPAQQQVRVLVTLLVCSLTLQLAGFIAPGWVVFSVHSSIVHIGLWFIVHCQDGTWDTLPTSDLAEYRSANENLAGARLSEYRGETCTALICCIIALICALKSRTPANRVPIYGATAILSLVAGILSLVPSGKVLDGTLKYGRTIRLIGAPNPFEPPYALILTMLGGGLACIGGLVGFWYTYRASQAPPQPALQQPCAQMLYMPPYSNTMVTGSATGMAPGPPAYPGINGGYVIEKAALPIGQQANQPTHVTY